MSKKELTLVEGNDKQIIANIVLKGDISGLKPEEKVRYYNMFCESLGLNPITKPFQILNLNGKDILYATKDATEQLRKINQVSVVDMTQEIKQGILIVKVKVQDKTGRTDISSGAVNIGILKGNDLANAIMKAETKAKRRATLSICGLGIMDETEIETVHGLKVVNSEPIKELKEHEKPITEEPEIPGEITIKQFEKDCIVLNWNNAKLNAFTSEQTNGKFAKWLSVPQEIRIELLVKIHELALKIEATQRTIGDDDGIPEEGRKL